MSEVEGGVVGEGVDWVRHLNCQRNASFCCNNSGRGEEEDVLLPHAAWEEYHAVSVKGVGGGGGARCQQAEASFRHAVRRGEMKGG